MKRALCGLLLLAAAPVGAVELTLPPLSRMVLEEQETAGDVRLPITPWQAGEVQSLRAEGTVVRQVWQIASPGLTTLQVLGPLREQIEAAGYDVLLECEAWDCGGFEFRYATETLPAPAMHVDLGDYRFLSSQRTGETGTSWLSLMVSRVPDRAFLQITRVMPEDEAAQQTAGVTAATPEVTVAAGALAAALGRDGRAVLDGVRFGSGVAEMGVELIPALSELVRWMQDNPDARVILVGHTDASGSLPGNIDLSRRRAEAVRALLTEQYGVDAGRIRSEGVGYLAPLTTNATDEGRERNRRVEVVVDTPE